MPDDSNATRAEKATAKAVEAGMSLAKAQARQRHAEASAEWERETHQVLFSKVFNTFLEAIMRDTLESLGVRFLAWLERYSWGSYSLYAIGEDGMPKYQVDCLRDLGLDPKASKSRLSHVVHYYQQRGYLSSAHGKKLVLLVSPVLAGLTPREVRGKEYQLFLEEWKVAHSTEWEDLEVARTTVRRIGKVIMADYKKSRDADKQARTSLLEIARQLPDAGSPTSSVEETPFQRDRRRILNQAKAAAQTHPDDGPKQSKAQQQAAAAELLFGGITRMQLQYRNTEFGAAPIERKNPRHQMLVEMILTELGSYDEQHIVGYLEFCRARFVGSQKGSKPRAPGMAGGPDGLGLLVNWAADYARICAGQPDVPAPRQPSSADHDVPAREFTTAEQAEFDRLRLEMQEVGEKLKAAEKDLKDAGTSSVHVERARRRISKLKEQRSALASRVETMRKLCAAEAANGGE